MNSLKEAKKRSIRSAIRRLIEKCDANIGHGWCSFQLGHPENGHYSKRKNSLWHWPPARFRNNPQTIECS